VADYKDHMRWYQCKGDSCLRDITHGSLCTVCAQEKAQREKLNELRPIIREVLKEEGLISRLKDWE